VAFCQQFLGPDQVLERVKYFTAPPLNIQKQKRQGKLFKANRLLNPDNLEFIIGKYYKINLHCPNCDSTFQKPEEKRTDVNISVQLIGDCALNNSDNFVLISADSDLAPALTYIKRNFQDKKIKVYSTPTCPYCHMVKEFLKKKSVKFEDIDVSKSTQAADEMVEHPEDVDDEEKTGE